MGVDAKPAIPDLVNRLKSEDRQVRKFAAEALGKIGPEAKSAVPKLVELLKDADPIVREAAFTATTQVDPEAKQLLPALTKLLDEHDVSIRMFAVQALGKVGRAATPAIPKIAGHLNDQGSDGSDIQSAVLNCLCTIGSAAHDPLPVKSRDKGETTAPWGAEAVNAVVRLAHDRSPTFVNVRNRYGIC